MLAQSTSTVTTGARRMKCSRCPITNANSRSAQTRKTAGCTRFGRKWLIHLAVIAGTARMSAIARVRFRSATANTPASRTNENKTDRMRWPPSSSSTKGADIKRTASAMRSCTVEKRWNLNRFNTGSLNVSTARSRSFSSPPLSSATPKLRGHSSGNALTEVRKSLRLVRKCARMFASI